MIDVVYVLGTGSVYDNLELKFSLRSIQKHLLNYGRVFIVGEMPHWCHNAIHLPYPDKYKYKQANICTKILRACAEDSISDEFLLCNDDHYLLKDVKAAEFPYYADGSIESEIKKSNGDYKQSLVNTLSALKLLSTHNFDCHVPIRYKKDQFANLMTSYYDWSVPHGYVIKSLYCNTLNIQPVPVLDGKVHDYIPQEKLEAIIATRPCLSTSNYAITNPMKRTLERLFPEKSCYER